MATKIEIIPEGKILRVQVEGTVNPHLDKGDLATLASILAACNEHDCEGILFDVSFATIVIDAIDMFQVGTTLAERMTPGVKIAVYYDANKSSEDPFFKIITDNRGIRYRAFEVESDALSWLGAKR